MKQITKKVALYYYEDVTDCTRMMETSSWVVTSEDSDYTRCTEVQEITFNMLPPIATTADQVAVLNKQKLRNMASFEAKQIDLQSRINDLLSLPAPLQET